MRLKIKRIVKQYMRDGFTVEEMLDEIIDVFKEEMYEGYAIGMFMAVDPKNVRLEFEKWYQKNYELTGKLK